MFEPDQSGPLSGSLTRPDHLSSPFLQCIFPLSSDQTRPAQHPNLLVWPSSAVSCAIFPVFCNYSVISFLYAAPFIAVELTYLVTVICGVHLVLMFLIAALKGIAIYSFSASVFIIFFIEFASVPYCCAMFLKFSAVVKSFFFLICIMRCLKISLFSKAPCLSVFTTLILALSAHQFSSSSFIHCLKSSIYFAVINSSLWFTSCWSISPSRD